MARNGWGGNWGREQINNTIYYGKCTSVEESYKKAIKGFGHLEMVDCPYINCTK